MTNFQKQIRPVLPLLRPRRIAQLKGALGLLGLVAGPGVRSEEARFIRGVNLNGPALVIDGVLRTVSDGHFIERQVRHGGWGVYEQGPTVVIETKEGHSVVLTSRRMAPMSLEQVISLGIRPERKHILIVKGVIAPRAAYEPIAAEIILVDTPGVTSDDPRQFQYANRHRPLYPLEADARYWQDASD